ncbi:MAG: TetR/AcrR family transcriptional regulator [Chloroflexi bacterium]|uniref:TetR/AcrR family transcriptional regulator n=1 Tax=Candidatus Flexifilum breve TaxID=3140694 RepID=UPI003134A33E|nr:TetR/AcrR family transcriptional regulator [Chloroflexota bacterium]
MPRPREFDRDDVINRALRLFWERGYEATSIRDLIDATGISSSSMYEAFGDKRGLFLVVLARFCAWERERIAQMALAAASPEQFVSGLFGSIEDAVQPTATAQGSLAFNTMVEFGTRDPDVTELLLAHHAGITQIVADVLRAGQVAGTVTSQQHPLELAYAIVSALHGVATVKGVKADFPYAAAITRVILRLLYV